MYGRAIVLLSLLGAMQAYPSWAGDNILRGKFTFDWSKAPDTQKCTQIGPALIAKFTSAGFHCDLTTQTNTASGVATSYCADKSSQYMIFATRADCEKERTTQAANED
jgi:hypothetical protein